MDIQKVLDSCGTDKEVETYVYLEQLVNDGSPSGFTSVHQVSEEFRPQLCRVFDLPVYGVDRSDIDLFLANPSESLRKIVEDIESQVKFCLHPDLKNQIEAAEPDRYQQVSPTASSRTVITRGSNEPYFIKLHYEGLLGRVDRKLTPKRVLGAAQISSELDYLIERGLVSDAFAFLPESYGATTMIHGREIGITYREYKPRPVFEDRLMIPAFSLFSEDKGSPDDLSLLRQILSRFDDKDSKFYDLIKLLIESFRTITLDGGLWPENHAQNILLEMDSYANFTRVVHRDLYEFYLDVQRRHEKGLSTDGFRKFLDRNSDRYLYFGQKSYLFDFKFGDYVLSPLVDDFCKAFGRKPSDVRGDIKDIFVSSSPEWRVQFDPYDSYFYFPKVERTYVNNRPNLLKAKNPKFR